MGTRGRRRGAREPEVQSITSARRALGEDVHARTVRYLVSMAIRTACVVGAVLTDGPVQWVMILGAVVLPYIAVVVANAGRERAQEPPQTYLGVASIEAPPRPAYDPETEYLR